MLAAVSKSQLLVFIICCFCAGFSLIKERIELDFPIRDIVSLSSTTTTTASSSEVPVSERIRIISNDDEENEKKEETKKLVSPVERLSVIQSPTQNQNQQQEGPSQKKEKGKEATTTTATKKRNIVLKPPPIQQQSKLRRNITTTATVEPSPSSPSPEVPPSLHQSSPKKSHIMAAKKKEMTAKKNKTETTKKKTTTTAATTATTTVGAATSDDDVEVVPSTTKKLKFVLERPPGPLEKKERQEKIQEEEEEEATQTTIINDHVKKLLPSSSSQETSPPITKQKKKSSESTTTTKATVAASAINKAGIKSKRQNTTKTTTTTKAKSPLPPPSTSSPPSISISVNLDDFRLCRVLANGTVPPTLHESPIVLDGMPAANNDNNTVSMRVDYQCNGEPYNQFANLFEEFLISSQQDSRHTNYKKKQWGKRKTIVPGSNRTILILGNSHTRQLITTILCQYRDQILVNQTKVLYSMPHNMDYGVWEIHLVNNLTIYAATNCPFIYNPQWYTILETQIIQQSFTRNIDAIIMGKFNHYTESTGTKFYDNMMEYQTAFPELNIDFEHSSVPTLEDIAKVFPGPILYVSMFAKYGNKALRDAVDTVQEMKQQQQQQRNNLVAIDGRKYVKEFKHIIMKQQDDKQATAADNNKQSLLLPVHECSMDGRYEVNTCVTNTSSYRFSNGHRCMGARGGHPDLIAWDVIESLHKLLGG